MHYFYPPCCCYVPMHYLPLRQTPPVNPDLLYNSAHEMKKLLRDANIVVESLSASKEFAAFLMLAAQESDEEEVFRLIYSIGVTSDVEVHYNPDGIRLEFKSQIEDLDCCKLTLALRWN
ncbi:hypothetical protein [Alteribacillus sp. YIM 98480]|uniref:hypothetical protein n=1 Tax=Alteribacillus sp. YIM 98480 TaxID=2606599 RepID=UPI00131E01BD|nr:hypothetical protein [Alteribacillus sp. YIM 98480]